MIGRCIPQVHGTVFDALVFVSSQLGIEMNSSTDNPLVFEDSICPISGKSKTNIISGGSYLFVCFLFPSSKLFINTRQFSWRVSSEGIGYARSIRRRDRSYFYEQDTVAC